MTEAYAVDETIHFDPSSATPYTGTLSPAMRKALEIGSLCNNASLLRNEDGVFVGQSTDVALLNVLSVAGISDRRNVRFPGKSAQNFEVLMWYRDSRDFRKSHSILNKSTWLLAGSMSMLSLPRLL